MLHVLQTRDLEVKMERKSELSPRKIYSVQAAPVVHGHCKRSNHPFISFTIDIQSMIVIIDFQLLVREWMYSYT